MRTPAVKTLMETFKLDFAQASLIRQLASLDDDADALRQRIAEKCPETDAYARSCYSDPFDSLMWRRTMVLHAIDKILGTHGVEALGPIETHYGPPYEYLNAGDPYVTTLIYKRETDNLYIGCWGTVADRHPSW